MILKRAEAARVVAGRVIETTVKVAASGFTGGPIVDRAVKRLAVVVKQTIRYQVGCVPVFRPLKIDVARVVPTAIVPVRLALIVCLI